MTNLGQVELTVAAQSHEETMAFIEAFARMNVAAVRDSLLLAGEVGVMAEHAIDPDWDDAALLAESGISPAQVDDEATRGVKYLHIEVAMDARGRQATRMFLAFTGLSKKQQKMLFPALSTRDRSDRKRVSNETVRLNEWLEWVMSGGFDPAAFVGYQQGIKTHGRTQNQTGAVGAIGAAVAFVDAIRSLDSNAIADQVGAIPPDEVRSPEDILRWRLAQPTNDQTLKAVLLTTGRAVVFASSKDANIFQALGSSYTSAAEALRDYNSVRNNSAARQQRLHEFAVGEVKTATDISNLHERMGLASRETQTELRTDRFLMMSVLNREILEGGSQRRTLNNRDLVRFTHVFNLHHCWGWDGGRERHPDHWQYFVNNVRTWCGL